MDPLNSSTLSISSDPNRLDAVIPIAPTLRDIEMSRELEEFLHRCGRFESMEESERRQEMLGKLDALVKEWVRSVGIRKGLDPGLAAESGGKIFTFGSYKLGVHSSGADIDTLCVAPHHVTRNDFFTSFAELISSQPGVTEFTPVPDAYVPVIKLCFDGIAIDLLFASLSTSIIPEDLDILNEDNLRGVDGETQRSLNGPRVAAEILSLVPNVENFRLALRAVKYWAKQRGIGSNVMGYFGGIALALLTARVCQIYPNASPNMLLSRFFKIYRNWPWPSPVMLKDIENKDLGLKVWNPQNRKDIRDLMPIITPTYPSMNSTYNVSRTTFNVIKEEISRGFEVTESIERGESTYEKLFEESDIFERHTWFLRIEVASLTEEAHAKWSGAVESKLRYLINALQSIEGLIAHPWPKSYDTPEAERRHPNSTLFFFALRYDLKIGGVRHVDLGPAIYDFSNRLEDFHRDESTMMGPYLSAVRRRDLPDFVFPRGRPRRLVKRSSESRMSLDMGSSSSLSSMPVTSNAPGVDSLQKRQKTLSDIPIHDLSSNDLEMEAANLSVLDTEESITRKPAIILQR